MSDVTVGQVVLFRHETFVGLELPAIVVATPASYKALSNKVMDAASGWNFPGFESSADKDDRQRVLLVVFTPSNKEPTRVPVTGGLLSAPCFQAPNVPYSEHFEPGTWGWPERA